VRGSPLCGGAAVVWGRCKGDSPLGAGKGDSPLCPLASLEAEKAVPLAIEAEEAVAEAVTAI